MSIKLDNSTEDLIAGLLKHGPEVLTNSLYHKDNIDVDQYFVILAEKFLDYPTPKTDFDINNWSIPEDYQNMDIEDWIYSRVDADNENLVYRVSTELALFKKYNMIPVLKTMKYIVDTLRANKIVWGVGRGSSVASYVLYLIGVHKIDSVKYNLPIGEFFKGE